MKNPKKFNDCWKFINLKVKKNLWKSMKQKGLKYYKDNLILDHLAYILVREILAYDLETLSEEKNE